MSDPTALDMHKRLPGGLWEVIIRKADDSATIEPLTEDVFTGRLGEVQETPTANTVLARLKDLLTGIVLAGGSNLIGKVRLTSAGGDEITEDTADAIKALLVDGSGNALGVYSGGTLKTARAPAGLQSSGILSADTSIKGSAGKVYEITVSCTAALNLELNDSTDNSGSDVWGITLPADGYAHYIFDPPFEFGTGIYLDVDTASCRVVVGYI